jgi:hypothetical protein
MMPAALAPLVRYGDSNRAFCEFVDEVENKAENDNETAVKMVAESCDNVYHTVVGIFADLPFKMTGWFGLAKDVRVIHAAFCTRGSPVYAPDAA